MMNAIVTGCYPELHCVSTLSPWAFYSDYVDSYIARDVMEIVKLKDQLKFFNFMQVMASMTGQELVKETVYDAVGIDGKTFNEWLSVLVAGDIITTSAIQWRISGQKGLEETEDPFQGCRTRLLSVKNCGCINTWLQLSQRPYGGDIHHQ